MAIVKPGWACPSNSDTTLIGVPAATVTAQRMVVHNVGQPRLDRRPDRRDNTRMKCEHEGDLHLVLDLGAP